MEVCGRPRRWQDILGPGGAESARSLPFRATPEEKSDLPPLLPLPPPQSRIGSIRWRQ